MAQTSAYTTTLLLTGDVMLGRGMDQAFARSCPPILYEPYVKDARAYLRLAEDANGPVDAPVAPAYPWSALLEVVDRFDPDLRIINLETAVTLSDDPWPGKGIHYRMHPENVAALEAASIDACVLANNHVLDWGRRGLVDTLDTLAEAGIRTAGAGTQAEDARAVLRWRRSGGPDLVLVAAGFPSSGIPPDWAAGPGRPGLHFYDPAASRAGEDLFTVITANTTSEDLVICSVHWGGNWGYRVPNLHRRIARRLIEEAGVDVVHGHSSHHPMEIEIHRHRLILYGCGDLLNDYEGIRGHDSFRPDLAFAYLPAIRPDGTLQSLTLLPFRIRKLQLQPCNPEERAWLLRRANRDLRPGDLRFAESDEGAFVLRH